MARDLAASIPLRLKGRGLLATVRTGEGAARGVRAALYRFGVAHENMTLPDRITLVIASEAKQSRSRRALHGRLDRRVASLLAMTTPSEGISL